MRSDIRNFKILLYTTVACVLFCDCVQTYVSPYKAPKTGYLVIDGYITGNGPTQYTLSRTIALPGDSAIPKVTGAQLQVEGSDNSTYPLVEKGNGVYGVDTLPLTTALQYRLRISLPGGETYLSDYVPYKPTPPIDSVFWIEDNAGVTIYVTTHDPNNATRYYQWSYDQTWQYFSAAQSVYMWIHATDSVVPRPDSLQIFTCWKDGPLTSILISTSSKLAQDVISAFPLAQIPAATQPLSVEYSIIVRQFALSDSAYLFLSQMKQNSESLGSIFDAQPTQLSSNIRSLSSPSEPVIGYISAGTVQQQRIFIRNNQLDGWYYTYNCEDSDRDISDDPESDSVAYGHSGLIPLFPVIAGGGYFANQTFCVDCRLQGGTTVKPTFWPN